MILTLAAILSSILVVTSTSTVYSVLWLVSTFIFVSITLGLLNMGFVALLYVIVYVGAIAILFLFVVQLLDLGSVYELAGQENWPGNKKQSLFPLATIIVSSIIYIVSTIRNSYIVNSTTLDIFDISSLTGTEQVGPVITNTSTGLSSIVETNHVVAIAEWFYGIGLLPLIVISIILLVAMIAPIYLCNRD